MLLHYQRFLVAGVSFVAIWYAALLQQQQQYSGGNNDTTVVVSVLVAYAPLWLIVAIGLYAVGSVLYGTLTFHDTPEAAQELERQIQEAKREMAKRGVIKEEEEETNKNL